MSKFSKYLDDFENHIVKENEIIHVEKPIKIIENVDIKDKLIYELTEFGIDFENIKKITNNVFSENERKEYNKQEIKIEKKSNFKENVNKVISKKENPIDHASLILEGVEDKEILVDINNVSVVDINTLNMNNVAEHASALL
jgi:hypothetical protein